MQFEFFTPTRIIFGQEKVNTLGELAASIGNNVLLIFNGPTMLMERVVGVLNEHVINCYPIKINSEPTTESIGNHVEIARQKSINLIIGLGGGSAIDSAKATASLMTNQGRIADYLEVIGQNKPLINPSIPTIAIPTTAGTGSEVTKNAVLGDEKHKIKVSLRSPFLYPRIALIDPVLTESLPQDATAFTGLDALTQLIESYISNAANPITDALCLVGIDLIGKSLNQVYFYGNDIKAREKMSLASLLSGISLANAKLGAVHGLAGPLGGVLSAPHGAICACLLPYVLKTNLTAMKDRSQGNVSIERLEIVSKALVGDKSASVNQGLKWINDFCTKAKIPHLSSYGLQQEQFDPIIENAINSSSMKGNPVTLFKDELRNILTDAF